MKDTRGRSSLLLAMSLALGLGLSSGSRAEAADDLSTAAPTQGQAHARSPQQEARSQARPDLEKQRREAEQQAAKALDRDAVAAVEETRKAAKAIAEDKPGDALAAIERATGKIDVLLARNSATGLIPVEVEAEIIDGAPADVQAIRERAKALRKAVGDKDYPAARLLLLGLTSELRVRTYDLPLSTYPAALKEAARLLDQKKSREAETPLLTALNTLVVIERTSPLPLLAAKDAIGEAQALHDRDRDSALKLLAVARNELDRAKELGYAGNDPEYAALNKAISDLEAQLKGHEDATSAFSRLKEKVAAFFKRQAETERR
jgi:hypothetical protein